MSGKIMGQIYDLDLPNAKQSVLLAMADHADHEGGNIYPGLGLIAWKLGYSLRQVQRIVAQLVDDGLLIIVEDAPGKKVQYAINLAAGKLKAPYKSRQNVTRDKMSPVTKKTPTRDIAMSPPPVTFDAVRQEPISQTESGQTANRKNTNRPCNRHVEPPPPPTPHTAPCADHTDGGGGGSLRSTEQTQTAPEPETLVAGGKDKAAGPGRNPSAPYTETERWLAAEGCGMAQKWRDLPLAAVQADVARRKALGQGWGAITGAWSLAPPGSAPPAPPPRPVETEAERVDRLRREYAGGVHTPPRY